MSDERRIVANTGHRVGAEVVSKVISLAFYVVLAREIGDAGFGVFTFGLALAMLVTTLANFGQDAVLVREVAPDRGQIDRFFADTLALKTVLAVPAILIAVGAAVLIDHDRETLLVIVLLGVAVAAETLMWTFFAAFQAFDRLGFISVVLVWQRLVTTAVGVPALLLGADVVAGSAVYLGGAVLGLALAAFCLLRSVVRPRMSVDIRTWWPLMRAAFPVGIASVFSTTLFRVDAALLAFFASAAVVGDYGAAYRLFETTLFLSYSVGTAVYPVFARLGPGSEPPLRVVRDGGLKLAIVATLPLAVAAAVLGPGLVPLVYGEAFDEGGIALVLLAPAIALYPIEHIAAAMLVAQRRQKIVAAVVGVVALQNVIANVLLIPVFSLKAAALNTSISEALLAISFLYLAGRTAGGFEWARVTAGPVLAAGLAGATMLLLRDTLPLAAAAGAVVYFTTLVTWERRRFPDDARLVSDLLLRRA